MFIKTCFFIHAMRLFVVPLTVDRSGQHWEHVLHPWLRRVKTWCRLHLLYTASSFLRPEGIEVSSHSFQLLAWDIPRRCFEENLKGDTFFSDVAYCFGSLWMPDPFQRLRDRESATPGKERAAPPQLESRPRFSAVVDSSIYIYIYSIQKSDF